MQENPYAPPETVTIEGDPASFWIEEGKLHLRDGGSLPEICLQTGAVDVEMVRMNVPFSWMPPWVCWLIIPLMMVAWFMSLPLVTLAVLVVWIFLLFRAQRVCRMGISVQEEPVKKASMFKTGQIVAAVLIVAGVTILDLSFELRGLIIFTALLLGSALLKRLIRGIRIEAIEEGVALLSEVNPEALRRLQEWQDHHS